MVCDGSGIIDETYIDADYAIVTKCPGCEGCDPAPPEFRFEAAPLWAGMEVYEVRPIPIGPDFSERTRALTA